MNLEFPYQPLHMKVSVYPVLYQLVGLQVWVFPTATLDMTAIGLLMMLRKVLLISRVRVSRYRYYGRYVLC